MKKGSPSVRIELIRKHPVFINEMNRIKRLEENRKYCGHNINHLLDVARVSWILVLENNLKISKDVIYATALLHDIGKGLQYEAGIPHHTAGADLSKTILADCNFSDSESDEIINAIIHHRKPSSEESYLVQILYEADKKTRLCFDCNAQHDCNWSDEKKNLKLIY